MKTVTRPICRLLVLSLIALPALTGCRGEPESASFLRQVPWAESGVWLKADTHTHTRFSDGRETVDQVVARAAAHGCDVVAITDHADLELDAATPEYFSAIDRAREANPDLIVLPGVEWNIPPFDGAKHATVLLPPGDHVREILAEFKQRYDDWKRPLGDPELSGEAMRWLSEQSPANHPLPVVLYNHPSRKDSAARDNLPHLAHWKSAAPKVFVGFSGAPGHQGDANVGSYDYSVRTEDRWDPAVARVGGVWDQLLGRGLDLWAARAPSDFHNSREDGLNDYYPGEFSETWLYAPDRSVEGVFAALRAGTFFANHGHIVRNVQLRVDADGLPRAAIAGESIRVPGGSLVTATVDMEIPDRDWRGRPNRVDSIELIVINGERARIAVPEAGSQRLAREKTLVVPKGGMVVRARGRRIVIDGPDLLFYTNPVRIETS